MVGIRPSTLVRVFSNVNSACRLTFFGCGFPKNWMIRNKRSVFFNMASYSCYWNRDDYWQAGFVIPKGQFNEIKERGLAQFQNDIAEFAGFLRDRVTELDDWAKIKLLTVRINRLRDWCREGLLCIGDSAHAMSPAGGVGI